MLQFIKKKFESIVVRNTLGYVLDDFLLDCVTAWVIRGQDGSKQILFKL